MKVQQQKKITTKTTRKCWKFSFQNVWVFLFFCSWAIWSHTHLHVCRYAYKAVAKYLGEIHLPLLQIHKFSQICLSSSKRGIKVRACSSSLCELQQKALHARARARRRWMLYVMHMSPLFGQTTCVSHLHNPAPILCVYVCVPIGSSKC